MNNLKNNRPLSHREIEVLHRIAEGFSTRDIANDLYISFETVRSHRKNLLTKMRAKNVAVLIRMGCQSGLITS